MLITSDIGIMPLAGAVGLYVARTPNSKPEVPPPPNSISVTEQKQSADGQELDKLATVGELADKAESEHLEIDNDTPTKKDSGSAVGQNAKKTTGSKPTKKIPNFEKFRTKLFIGIVAVICIAVGLFVALRVLPKAKIILTTDTSNLSTNLKFIANPNAQRLDAENSIVPAISKEYKKTDTEKAIATGEKNIGDKASGSITIFIACADVDGVPPTIPAGTGVSTNNLTFITKNTVQLTSPDFSDGCKFTGTTPVTAQHPGDEYNFGAGKSFAVAGYSAVSAINNDSMTGGTDKIVKVVSQEDIDKARDAITKRASNNAPAELKKDIQGAGYWPIEATLKSNKPSITNSKNVGDEANEVIVTSVNVFSMLGVKERDLKLLIERAAKEEIDSEKQVIRDDGLSKASIRLEKTEPNGQVTLSLQTIVVAGPEIDEQMLKQQIAGKKRGEIQEMLKERPGIKDVSVDYSPFWVRSAPNNIHKITIVVEGKAYSEDANERH